MLGLRSRASARQRRRMLPLLLPLGMLLLLGWTLSSSSVKFEPVEKSDSDARHPATSEAVPLKRPTNSSDPLTSLRKTETDDETKGMKDSKIESSSTVKLLARDDPIPLPVLLPVEHSTCKYSSEASQRLWSKEDSQEFQRMLWSWQHPADCSSKKLYIYDEEFGMGLGSSVHIRAHNFAMALQLGRVFVHAPDLKWEYAVRNRKFCQDTSADCYFFPVSSCSAPPNYREQSELINDKEDGASNRTLVRGHGNSHKLVLWHNFVLEPPQFHGRFKGKTHRWWMSQIVRYLMRPNQRCLDEYINPALKSVFPQGIPPNMASIFIRHGDKHYEAKRRNVREYFDRLAGLDVKEVYIGSDSASVIAQAKSKYGSRYRLYHLPMARTSDGFRLVEFRRQGNAGIEGQHLAELFLSIQAAVVVGTFTSNWCRLVHELHDQDGHAACAYISLDDWGETDR